MIRAAVMVAKIAAGGIEDAKIEKNLHAVAPGKMGGKKGGKAKARSLSESKRKGLPKKAARAR